jgi:putative FmdB family regulatory protein
VPTYSYACTECGNRFDIVQGFSDDALTTCEKCSGRLRKLFNSVGIVFKGSGFYRTDSRESGKKSSKTPANGSTTSDATSNSGSSEKNGSSQTNSSSEKSSSSPAPSTAAAST